MESHPVPIQKHRLIVLLPEALAGKLDVAKKVFWLAVRYHYDVIYLTIVENSQNTLQARRYMATTAAATTGDTARVSCLLSDTSNWQQKLKELYTPGDILVCQQEQWVRDGTLKTIPVSDYLKIKYQAPIIPLAGFYHPQREQVRRWLASLIFWIGSLLILGLFTFLEIQVDQKMPGFGRGLLLFLCILGETGTILIWHNLTNR